MGQVTIVSVCVEKSKVGVILFKGIIQPLISLRMTSLAKQLQRLAVPQTQVVFSEDRRKASLLFDHKEAAAIDRETFFALGLNGLEELETLDSNFQEFENSLFAESSLTFERSVQTKEVNEKLDVTIQRFLIRLSPFCLLKPAHKALEWLIHRFHIHFSNTDDLLLCFLPYHESKIFVRVLQLIRFDSKLASKWDWLEPLQKSGVHLSRTTLVNHCRTNPAFLSFVCDMVPNYVKVLSETDQTPKCRVLFSFYATTVIAVLESGSVTEVILSTLLPHLSRGMQSHLLEYKAASYMILAQLFYKTSLKSNLVKTLQHVIAKSVVPELVTEAVATLMLMFQTQDISTVKITKKTFKYLCQDISVIDAVLQLYSHFESKQFLSCLLSRLIPSAFKHAVGIATSGESSQSESSGGLQEYMPMLHRLLSAIKLPDDVAEEAAFQFLSVYIKHGNKYLDDDVDDRIKDSLQGIVRQLEGRHSAAVDRAVSRVLSECKKQTDRDLVQEFLNLYVLSVPHQLVTDSETSLVLSINHRLPSVREKAVATLIKGRNELEDPSFLKDSLLLRLKDEDPQVVCASLAIGQEIWKIGENDVMIISHLRNILLKAVDEGNWTEAGRKASKLLGNYRGDETLSVFTSCLPCFFLTKMSKFNIEVTDTLMSSPLFHRVDMLKVVSKAWKSQKKVVNDGSLGATNVQLANCVALGLQTLVQSEDGIDTVRRLAMGSVDGKDRRVTHLMLLALDNLVSMATIADGKLEHCFTQLQLIDNIQKNKSIVNEDVSQDVTSTDWGTVISSVEVQLGHRQAIPQVLIMKAINTIVSAVMIPEQLTGVFMDKR